MAKTLFIPNDPPYGTERSYNALRLAAALAKREGEEVKLFLVGAAASCAKANQKVPQGYYNVEVMLRSAGRRRVLHRGRWRQSGLRRRRLLRRAQADHQPSSSGMALASRQGALREVVAVPQAVGPA